MAEEHAADELVIEVEDDGHRLALEQVDRALASDLAAAEQLRDQARRVEALARGRYVQRLARLAQAARPGVEVPEGSRLMGDVEGAKIRVRRAPEAQ